LKVVTVAHSTWHGKSLQPDFAAAAVIDSIAKSGNVGQYPPAGACRPIIKTSSTIGITLIFSRKIFTAEVIRGYMVGLGKRTQRVATNGQRALTAWMIAHF
jgi:hypothetical protein